MPIRPEDTEDASRGSTYRVRLPGFIAEDVGLGDAIKRVTSYVGILPCGGCQRRSETLNRLLTFTTTSSKENRR